MSDAAIPKLIWLPGYGAHVNQLFQAYVRPVGGVPPKVVSLKQGSKLPPGMSLVSPEGNHCPTRIQGICSQVGQYTFTLVVKDSKGQSAEQQFTLDVQS